MKFRKPGNYWFILPWVAFIPWWGMLVTMLICWAAQGHPIYWFMNSYQFPVYISDIGATNLRPLFISCGGWQGLGWVLTILMELIQRNYFLMNPWFTIDERNLLIASFFLGGIGELGLLFATIFSTAHYHHVHISMVAIFIIFMFLSVVCLIAQYYIMGRHYAMIHYKNGLQPGQIYEESQLKWYQWRGYRWNKFTISATVKTVWLSAGVAWAICFASIKNESRAADFEWLLAFWFGLIFIILSVDFYLGSLWKKSKYFPQLQTYGGYYKFERYMAKRGGFVNPYLNEGIDPDTGIKENYSNSSSITDSIHDNQRERIEIYQTPLESETQV